MACRTFASRPSPVPVSGSEGEEPVVGLWVVWVG